MKLFIIIAALVRYCQPSDPWAGVFYRQRAIMHMRGI